MATAPRPEASPTAVTIYLTPWCGFCRAAVRLLDQKGIEYTAHDVRGDDEARVWMREASGQPTVPQIFIHGRSVGGYTELAELERSGELTAALGQ